MTEGEGTKEKIELFIERYKLFIGSFLLFFIILGGGLLIYQKNIQSLSYNEKLFRLEDRIDELELTIAEEKSKGLTEVKEQSTESTQVPGQVAGASTKENIKEVVGKININMASETELDALPGIGPTYAKRIIEYRTQVGGFKSIEEIKNVKGIGDKTFEKFRDKISVQ